MTLNLARIRYPMFFIGMLLITVPAIGYKYYPHYGLEVTYSVVVGFLLFAASLISGVGLLREQ